MDDRSKRIIESAIEEGLLTPEEAEDAERIYRTIREVGVDQPMDEILVKKGFLTGDQIRTLTRGLSDKKVGKYQILEKLGEGGAGIVYKANQEPLERKVAIKVLSRKRVSSEKYLERFIREARVAVTLNHQNIVRGLDYGEADGYHYFVMEYVEGTSLYDILKSEGTLDERRALEVVLQTVHALQHAAEYNLVHRDIKPENILINDAGVVKVCDLGLAKPSLVETAKTSHDGTTIGTPTYMSPEQIRGKDETDFRADVYSLGATLYHMVAGRPPFQGASADVVVRKHLREQPTDPREHNLKLSSSSAAIIVKMLAKDPGDRYGSLDDLEEDVKAVLGGRPPVHTIRFGTQKQAARVPADLGATVTPRVKRNRKKSMTPLILGLVALLGVGAAIFVLEPFSKPVAETPETDPNTTPNPPRAKTTDQEAEALYNNTHQYVLAHPDIPTVAKRERYQLVVDRFPDTPFALHAKDRMREIDEEVADTAARHERAGETAWSAVTVRVKELVSKRRFGDALAALDGFPARFQDTAVAAKVAEEKKRLGAEADRLGKEAFAAASSFVASGRFDEAAAVLEALENWGLDDLAERVETRLAEIRQAGTEAAAAREQGAEIFQAVVGAAFARAADGQFRDADQDLRAARERTPLAPFEEQLETARAQLGEAQRFADAMVAGGKRLEGEFEKLALTSPAGETLSGRVRGAARDGIRLSRGGGEQIVPWKDLAPPERVRIGFKELDIGSAKDHGAAALYLVITGFVEDAKSEIEAARILGADPRPLESRRAQYTAYLRARADSDIHRAEVHRVQKRFDEARKALDEIVLRTPWYDRARFLLGAVLVEMGKHADGLAELERALALETQDPDVYYFLGEALYHLNRPAEALSSYSRYVEVGRPGDEYVAAAKRRVEQLLTTVQKERVAELEDRAKNAYRRKRWQEAADLYIELHTISPEEMKEALFFAGKAYLELGAVLRGYVRVQQYLDEDGTGRRGAECRRLIRDLLKEYGDSGDTRRFVELGMLEYGSGAYEPALTLFEKAVGAGPLNANAYFHRAHTFIRLGETTHQKSYFEAADRDLDTTLLLEPTGIRCYEGLALCAYYLGHYEDAFELAKRTIRELPQSWQGFNVAGSSLVALERYEEALPYYNDGLKVDRTATRLYLGKAASLVGLDRLSEALQVLDEALNHAPDANQIEQISAARARVLERQEK